MAVEFFLRLAFKLDTGQFIGPTLASAGAGMLFSLVTYSKSSSVPLPESIPVSPELKEFMASQDLRLEANGVSKVRVFNNIVIVLTLVVLFCWFVALVLSTQMPQLVWLSLPVHYYPGFASYLVGLVFSEIKETL